MKRFTLTACAALCFSGPAFAQQVPNATPDIPVSAQDRFYTSDQFSNTVSVIDPSTNTLLGVIKLGDQTPANLSPLYKGQLLVHGMGFSPDRKTLAAISIGSNSVTFIDTATNAVKHTTYVGRSPHEAFFRPDGREVWVAVRGEDYIQVLDGKTFAPTTRIPVPNGPGMTIFSPNGKYGYVCSSFSPETVVIDTASKKIVGRVKQASPFCPDIAATPDGKQVWLTLKDVGKVMVFDAKPPFASAEDVRHRRDHQPRQHRPHQGRPVRLCDGRHRECREGVPHHRLRAGRKHPGRRAAARSVAVGRRLRGSMSGWRTPTLLRRSTPPATPSSRRFRSVRGRKAWPMFPARCR